MKIPDTTGKRSVNASINKEFTDKIFSLALDWYKSAESKAQIILGILTSLIFFVFGVILLKPNDIKATLLVFDTTIWVLLSLTIFSIIIVIIASFACLVSKVQKYVPQGNTQLYANEHIIWFGYNAFHDGEKLRNSLLAKNEDDYIDSFSRQITILSKNVHTKHKMVNLAFIFAFAGLISLLSATVYYVLKLL